jgi:hypothetical protein
MGTRTRFALMMLGLCLAVLVIMDHSSTTIAHADTPGVCQLAYGETPQEIPDWLQPVESSEALQTHIDYNLLAAALLMHGLVDCSTCPAWGLNADGSANGCGLEISRDGVHVWQNQYDEMILSTSQTYELPPKVIKAVIAVESQFWPAADWVRGEIGLAQLTVWGADMTLRWNEGTYQRICRRTLEDEHCLIAYVYQDGYTQSLLQGALLSEVDATCPYCSGGVDVSKSEQAITGLAESLQASCRQTRFLIKSKTTMEPAQVMSYEDFWRLVLVNYHAGSGCVSQMLQKSGTLDNWHSISLVFPGECVSGATYIWRIEEQLVP